MVDDVLVYNFQILFKQTSIIAADIYKHVSVLFPQKHYRETCPDSGTMGSGIVTVRERSLQQATGRHDGI